MKGRVVWSPSLGRWDWRVADNEGELVAEGWAWTETAAHAALRHAASLQWPRGDED